jgi:hypothetical protein
VTVTRAFVGSIGDSFYNFGNCIEQGHFDPENFDEQFQAQVERNINIATNLNDNGNTLVNGYVMPQVFLGEWIGTNSLAWGITGYDAGQNRSLSIDERIGMTAGGIGQIAGNVAIACKVTGVNPRLTRVNTTQSTPLHVQQIGDEIKNWLGRDYRVVTNTTGDTVFISKDGLRKFRTDFYNNRNESPHVHLEVFRDGKWRDAIPDQHKLILQGE